jgi:dTDP-4-amino-4,6-dideoxygalactose transaminase
MSTLARRTLGSATRTRLEPLPFLDLSPMSQEVRDEVLDGWADLVRTGAFVGGEPVARFESEWAAYCGTRYAVGVANGTDALHLALRAIGIGPGDEVVVPANTFVATVEAILLAGAQPRFADVDDATLLITPATFEAAVTPATRAVIVVHLYGQMPDMVALSDSAARLGIRVVEDAAQAQGAAWLGRQAGSFGAVGCFSFYPGKNLGAFGDAGAVVTSDPEVDARLRSLRDHGRSGSGHYQHDSFGLNSRLDAVQAVVLSAKLRRLEAWNAARRALYARYGELVDSSVVRLVDQVPDATGVVHLAVARVRERDRVREELAAMGIGTGIHYPTPCHQTPAYRRFADGPLPVVEAAAPELISLPMFPHLARRDVARVAEALNAVAPLRDPS